MPLFPDLPEIAEAITNPTAEDYATAAKYALKRKQRPLAVQQVAAALALDPQNLRYLQLLSDIVGTTPDPLALLHLRPEGTFYGLAAARSWMLAKQARSTEATRLLTEVVKFRPNIPFLAWLRDWEERFEWLKRVSPDAVTELLRGLVSELLAKGLEPGGEENLETVLQAAETLQTLHPGHASLRAARMWAHRQLGEGATALALASAGPVTWETELERARTLRSLGRRDEAVSGLHRTLSLAPNESSAYLELARALVDLRRRADAQTVLRRARDLAPSASGHVALTYLEWVAGDSALPFVPPDDNVARSFARDGRCYRDALPDPNDEAVGVVRSALSRARETAAPNTITVRATVRHRAAPSAFLAFELGLAAMGKHGNLTLVGSSKSTALGELWSTESEPPKPLLPPPTFSLVAHVAALAYERFERSVWLDAARRLATGRLAGTAPFDLLSVALHPPAAPPTADAVQWLTHVHVAVGMLLGVMNDSPEREHAISRCLEATGDWVCNVGLVARYAAVVAGTASSEAVSAQFALLLRATDQESCYARTLALLGSLLGGTHVDAFKDARAQIAFEIWDGS